MGQPKVAFVTWRDRIRRISQGFYETMGQQIPQTRRSKPMRAWSHVKILNRDLRSTVIFLRKPKGIGQTFRLRGRHCNGNFYGTTYNGGFSPLGTVFMVTAAGARKSL